MPLLITITLLACILIVYFLAGFIKELIWFDGITIRVFSKNSTHKTHAEALLEYQPTWYIPLISARYGLTLFAGDYWEEIPREIVKKPSRITDTYTEYRIKTTLKYPGGYVLKRITLNYGPCSFQFEESDHKYDDNADFIKRVLYNYKNGIPSFFSSDYDKNTNNDTTGKIPLRSEHETYYYPHEAMTIPLSFKKIECIDHYCYATYEEYHNTHFNTKIITTPDVVTGRSHQVVLKDPPEVKQDKNGNWSINFSELDLEEKPIKEEDDEE